MNQFFSQAINIHRGARCKKDNGLTQLSRTLRIWTTDINSAVVLLNNRPAIRARCGKVENFLVSRSSCLIDSHHMRNNPACFFNDYRVADHDSQALKFVTIVQAGTGNDRAVNLNRFQFCNGSQSPRFTDLNGNITYFGFCFVAFPFVRPHPSW